MANVPIRNLGGVKGSPSVLTLYENGQTVASMKTSPNNAKWNASNTGSVQFEATAFYPNANSCVVFDYLINFGNYSKVTITIQGGTTRVFNFNANGKGYLVLTKDSLGVNILVHASTLITAISPYMSNYKIDAMESAPLNIGATNIIKVVVE